MRLVLVASSLVSVLLVPSLGTAQQLQSFQDLPLRLNLHDDVQIEDRSGARFRGRLTGLTRDEITIQTAAGEQHLARPLVREVAVRRRAVRTGVLVGASAGAIAGALAACAPADRSECADGPLVTTALGAGLGAAVSALTARMTTVYRASGAASPSETMGPPGPLADLALRIDLGDRVRLEERSGQRTNGRLTRLNGDEIAIATTGGERRFAAAAVREVARRTYPLGRSSVIGAGALAALAIAAPKCRSNSDCQPAAAAALGAGVGLTVGALLPLMTTVFRAPGTHALFVPLVARGVIGVGASVRW